MDFGSSDKKTLLRRSMEEDVSDDDSYDIDDQSSDTDDQSSDTDDETKEFWKAQSLVLQVGLQFSSI